MRQVQYSARGYPARAYAKWLVLNFAWNTIDDDISSGSKERKFRYVCERNEWDILSPLNKALVQVFRAAIKFYKLNKGEGEEAMDISTFFQRSRLHSEFSKFWTSSKNSHRNETNRYFEKFKEVLKNIEIEE